MGAVFLIGIGLPLIALAWFGAFWCAASLWRRGRVSLALAKVSDERVRDIVEDLLQRAQVKARRGY